MLAAAQAPMVDHTLVMEHVATHVVTMAVERNPGCDAARQLLAPGIACTAANILVVNPQGYGRIRRASEFMAVCRVRPGELSYGSAGAASRCCREGCWNSLSAPPTR
jgi:transposase